MGDLDFPQERWWTESNRNTTLFFWLNQHYLMTCFGMFSVDAKLINTIRKHVLLGNMNKGHPHKRYPHKFWNFWDPRSPCPGLSTFGWPPSPPSPCPCGHKAGIIWNIATCEQFTVKGKKKLIILFENNVKNIRMKTIFEMMSLHCVPYILYWIQADWKFYIQTYCQIIWVNFANMVTIIFFQADVHIWLTPPPPPVPHFCLTPLPP